MVGMRGMIDWAGRAQRKYDIQQQGANADTSRAASTRMQAETQASLAPSAIAGTEADAAVARARAAGMPGLIASEIGVNNANAGLLGANATGQRITNTALATQPTEATMEALGVRYGLPTLTNILSSSLFQPVAPSVNLPGPAAGSTRTPTNRGALSVTEDENGIRVGRGLGMF
jgi:hypothetical protein